MLTVLQQCIIYLFIFRSYHAACGILVPLPGNWTSAPCSGSSVWNTGPPGKSPETAYYAWSIKPLSVQFRSVQSLSRVQLFATPWIAARQAPLSITSSQSLLKLMPIELVMPSIHLILCCPLLFLPAIPPSITVFSNESTLRMRQPKYWSLSFSISPSNEHPGLISFRMDWLDILQATLGWLKYETSWAFRGWDSAFQCRG